MSNAAFLQDPKTFCDAHALHPTDADPGLKQKAEGYFSVPGDKRVSYCELMQNVPVTQGFISAMSNAWAARIFLATPGQAANGNRFPIYYLPWIASRTVRTTLKSKQNGIGGAPIDPDYFITSAVDGCSVFVEGDRANPTVYHANAYDPASGPVPVGPAATPQANAAFWDPKTTRMEQSVAAANSPKSVRISPALQANNPSKAVHAQDYMDLPGTEEANQIAAETLGVKQEFKTNNPHTKKIRFTDIIYKPCGTIFGWRQGGLWSFYYQRRAILYFYPKAKKTGLRFGTLEVNSPVIREVVLSCDEFYPNGSGRVFARPYNDTTMTRAFQQLFG